MPWRRIYRPSATREQGRPRLITELGRAVLTAAVALIACAWLTAGSGGARVSSTWPSAQASQDSAAAGQAFPPGTARRMYVPLPAGAPSAHAPVHAPPTRDVPPTVYLAASPEQAEDMAARMDNAFAEWARSGYSVSSVKIVVAPTDAEAEWIVTMVADENSLRAVCGLLEITVVDLRHMA